MRKLRGSRESPAQERRRRESHDVELEVPPPPLQPAGKGQEEELAERPPSLLLRAAAAEAAAPEVGNGRFSSPLGGLLARSGHVEAEVHSTAQPPRRRMKAR